MASSAPAIFGQAFRGFRGTPSLPAPPVESVQGGGSVDPKAAKKTQVLGDLIADLEIEEPLATAILSSLGATKETKVERLAFAPREVL